MRRHTLPVLHSPPSLSKSGLLLSPCLAWAGPQARWYDEKRVDAEDTTKRDDGIAFHHVLDNTAKGIATPIPEGLAKQVRHATNYLTDLELRSELVQSEVPVSVHWVDGKAEILVGVKNREYPERPGWQNGTADLVAILSTGELYVGDWKTGGTEGAEEQLLSLACALQRCIPGPPFSYGSSGDTVGSIRKVRIACLQVNEDAVWAHEREVPQDELDAHWDAMRFQWEDIGKRNDYVPGIHCTTLYCPHLGYCNATGDSVRKLAMEAPPPTSVAGGPLQMGQAYTDEPKNSQEAGETMARVSAAKRQIKYVEAGMKEYVKKGGRVLAGGFEWADGGNGFRWRKQ